MYIEAIKNNVALLQMQIKLKFIIVPVIVKCSSNKLICFVITGLATHRDL